MNENELVYKEVYDECKQCPYCHTDEYVQTFFRHWHGAQDEKFHLRNLFKETHDWEVFEFCCRKCGAKWESPPFRTDYPNDCIMRELEE